MDAAAVAEHLRALGIECLTEDLDPYGRDETMDLFHAPELVVRPRSTPEVQEVLRLANREGIPVTPRGGGTGKAGGCIPVAGGIVLTLERMNRIKEIDASNRFAIVEPGVVLWTLHEECRKLGLLYPVDMSSGGSCELGGNLACDGGGERAVKYGTTRAQVAGVEAVLMGGEVIRTGGKLRKNAAGYALHHLIVGSEGTLAVITEATLRLVPLPPHRKTLLAAFASLDRAAHAALEVEAKGFPLSAIELVEKAAADLAERMLGIALPHPGAGAYLLVEVEGFQGGRTEEEIEAVGGALLEAGAEEVDVAPREKVWAVRHAVAEAIKKLPAYSAVDAVVPRTRMPELIRRAHAAAKAHGVEVVCFGHAGDGNIHVDFIRRDAGDARWEAGIGPAVRAVLEATVALGGSVTAEHGVGLLRRDDLPLQIDAATRAAMASLKRAWDPKGLLNPKKIWPQ
ncbi:MAG TPA: FAD-binding oxidoreductase [Planctomycetota bacterium]|nr:FAD-binding oxidoreductase [Planctomycetota bacterium]